MKRFLGVLMLAISACAGGCEQVASDKAAAPTPKPASGSQKVEKKVVESKAVTPKVVGPAKKRREKLEEEERQAAAARSAAGSVVEQAVGKIGTAIKESVEVGPTLVVWLVDRSPSAQKLVAEFTNAAKRFYDSPEMRELVAGDGKALQTAIAAFDEKLEFVLDPPTGDREAAKAGFGDVRASSAGHEMTFGAIKQALDKYLPLRTGERREIILVVVTDEAGDDAAAHEDLIGTMRRSAIPLYVIGLPAPWGEVNPFAPNTKAIDETKKDDSLPVLGPESLLSERVDIQGWFDGRSRDDLALIDSGFGPFALERLCRASRGQFIALRPQSGRYFFGGAATRTWPTGDEVRFTDGIQSKYAPNYVSQAEYQKLLTDNKARAALVEAAKMKKLIIEGFPESRFPKAAEAKMAKKLSQAQQFAARNSPVIDQLYAVLAPGEADREKLTEPRWQAEFDLAMGRVMAMKVRVDGYNSMIAALKRGKTFTNASSNEWHLVAADSFETESTLKRMGEKAKMYLERVVKEHAGTPWARIAEEELKTPLGWTWKEA